MSELTKTIPTENRPTTIEIDFVELYKQSKANWRFLLVFSTSVAALVLTVSLLAPKSYNAEATILPTSNNDSTNLMASSIAAQLGASGFFGGMNSGRTAELAEIAGSRILSERVIAKSNLDRELTGWKTRQELIEKVQESLAITPPSLNNKLLRIKFTAPDANLAANVANTYVSELKILLDEIGFSGAAKNRNFLEKQLKKTTIDLTQAENKLSQFQTKNNLVSLPESVLASIQSLSNLEAQRIESEIQLKTTNETLNEIRNKVQALQADPRALLDLEIKRKSLVAQELALSKAKEEFINKLSTLPPKGVQLARLQREVQVQNVIYLTLTQQYQTALINEVKESDAFILLDSAIAPEKASHPKPLINMIIGWTAGLFIGIILIIRRENHHQAKQ